MEYKGYLAAVEFDDSSDILHGRVINSGAYPIATFEAADTAQLRREFHRSIDEYLAWCQEDGVEPTRGSGGSDSSESVVAPQVTMISMGL